MDLRVLKGLKEYNRMISTETKMEEIKKDSDNIVIITYSNCLKFTHTSFLLILDTFPAFLKYALKSDILIFWISFHIFAAFYLKVVPN